MNWNTTRALVTGASRGLGAALAAALVARGAQVVGVARDAAALRARLAPLGDRAHAVQGDVGDGADVQRIIAVANTALGGVDLLVNNASTLGAVPLPLLLDLAPDTFARTLAVNTVGPLRLIHGLAGPMVLRGHGAIVNISSDAAVEAYPEWGGYGASKAALDHLSRTLAAELDGTGVQVLAVDPGEMHTAMHAAALPDADVSSLRDPAAVAEALLDRLAQPASTVRTTLTLRSTP
ncbi:MAG: NAD(P)-dependent dehydrogenase (short-subunit alcohol dehydrogenase family) [Myxococcota bacterium]|jgi:NAD(P)-dependent dehydrogenase (short-subunit alcohol dehydrogenase family)